MPVVPRRVLVVLALAGAGLVPAPALAEGYCAGSGVNVVVDYGAIGPALEKGCGSGATAAAVFTSAGVGLTRDQQYQAVVCKVEGLPTDANCATMPPADAYWGLFWSDGTSGNWVYSSVSVDALSVPDGGFVAFAWQSTSTQRRPAVSPANPHPSLSPSPTGGSTTVSTKKPTRKPASGSAASATPTPSVTATPAPSASATASASAPPSETPTPGPEATTSGPATVSEPEVTARADDPGGGGLAWWVPVVVLAVLAGGGGAVWWSRKRGTT